MLAIFCFSTLALLCGGALVLYGGSARKNSESAPPAHEIVCHRDVSSWDQLVKLIATPSCSKRFIIACVHNAGRSQMAAAFFNALVDRSKAFAVSAGSDPAKQVHPEVLTVMNEVGIDLSGAVPQLLTKELAADADSLITMGCGDKCPYVPGVKRADWNLADPKGQSLETVRRTRDSVKSLVEQLIAERGLG